MSRKTELYDEFVQNVYQDYSLESIKDLLLPTYLLENENIQYVGSLERYVFLQGNESEVYTKPEIDFIEKVSNILVFNDYYKKTRQSTVPCRIISARIDYYDIVLAGIAFTKIINKALDGMNICLIVAKEGLLFAGRDFSKRNENNCFVSEIIRTASQYEELTSDLFFAPEYDDFVEYYSYIKDILQYKELLENPDENFILQDTQNSYREVLRNVMKILYIRNWIDFETECYVHEEPGMLPYSEKVKECEAFLFNIEFSRVNTIEMLFEAEELEKMADTVDELYVKNTEDNYYNDDSIDIEAMTLLNNPDEIIKLLKTRRNI